MSLSLVALGCLIGLATFAQVLSCVFKHYHDLTIALLIGLMIGSLRKIWPWKETISTILDRHGHIKPVVQHNIMPIGNLTAPVLIAIFGFMLVFVLELYASQKDQRPPP